MTDANGGGQGGTRGRAVVWLVLVLALISVAVVAGLSLLGGNAPELDRLGPAPGFTLTAQTGADYDAGDLHGQVWLTDFIFTTCRGICPVLAGRMLEFQERLADRDGWRIVSISVDPGTDTPEVLTAYADSIGADPKRWTFLTGDKREIFRIISDGFHLVVEEGTGDVAEPTLHSPRIVLVDREGEIRGYYDALDDESMALLMSNIEGLLAGGR